MSSLASVLDKDLKKQTAMRLEHEQDQQRMGPGRNQREKNKKSPKKKQTQVMPDTQAQVSHQVQSSSNRSNFKDHDQQHHQADYQHVQYQTDFTSTEGYPQHHLSPPSLTQAQQRQSKVQIPRESPHLQRQSHQISPTSRGQLLHYGQNLKYQLDMSSETSSVRSYEYDCGASTASNFELAEAGSTVSGESGSRYQPQQQVSAPQGLPISPLPAPFSNSFELGHGRQARGQMDSYSILSNSCTKSSSKGGVSNAPAVPACSRSQKHVHNSKGRIRKQQKGVVSHPCPSQQNLSPNNFSRQQHYNQDTLPITPAVYSREQQLRTKHGNVYHQSQATQKHSKLPHGLTVHELKEMTRARLAAEAAAAEKQEHVRMVMRQEQSNVSDVEPSVFRRPGKESSIHSTNSFNNPDLSPQILYGSGDSQYQLHQVRRRSTENSNQHHVQPSNHTSQSWHSTQQHLVSHHNRSSGSQTMRQLHKSNMYGCQVKVNQHQPTFHNQQGQLDQRQICLDSQETASVNSFGSARGSESVQSASIIGSGLQPPPDTADGCLSFGRSWSYPAGATLREAVEKVDTPKSLSPFFESSCAVGSIGGNRRRVGSSPPGFHLGVPLEDRPLAVAEDLSLPLFETPNSNNRWANATQSDQIFNYKMTSSGYSSHICDSLSPHPIEASQGISHEMEKGTQLNLPPLSMNEVYRGMPVGNLSMSGDLPNWMAENVLLGHPLHDRDRAFSSDNLYGRSSHNRIRSFTDEASNAISNMISNDNVTKKEDIHKTIVNVPFKNDSVESLVNVTNHIFHTESPIGTNVNDEVINTNVSSGMLLFPPEVSESSKDDSKCGGAFSAVMSPIGHSIADFMRLPNHFGSFLSLNQNSSEGKNSRDSSGSDDSDKLVSRMDPEVPGYFNRKVMPAPLVAPNKDMKYGPFKPDMFGVSRVSCVDVKAREVNQGTSKVANSSVPSKFNRNRSSSKKKRVKNRKKRDDHGVSN